MISSKTNSVHADIVKSSKNLDLYKDAGSNGYNMCIVAHPITLLVQKHVGELRSWKVLSLRGLRLAKIVKSRYSMTKRGLTYNVFANHFII